jgi:hypothetical protein
MTSDRERFDREFDKAWRRTEKLAIVAGVVYLALVGVIIWAVIRLVLHFA